MSNDSMRRSGSSGGGAPMGSTVAIVVTAVAVILGFLILRKVNDKPDTGSAGNNNTTLPATTLPLDTVVTDPPTTQPAVNKTATKVQVANASKISGVAKQLTTALKDAGFDVSTATNASVTTPAASTKVIYDQTDPNALGVANLVSQALGGVPVEPAPNPPPVKDGSFAAGSKVIVLLGTDLAGKPLAGSNGSVGAVTQSSVATSST